MVVRNIQLSLYFIRHVILTVSEALHISTACGNTLMILRNVYFSEEYSSLVGGPIHLILLELKKPIDNHLFVPDKEEYIKE